MTVKQPEGKYSGATVDCRPLMKQIAAMANMDWAGISRMVLILDVQDIPRLYVESSLDRERSEGVILEKTELTVKEEKINIKDTTTVHNELFKTFTPVPEVPDKLD